MYFLNLTLPTKDTVIKEEVDELWDDIKMNIADERLEKEAVHVAAMAIRFLVDVCRKGG